MNDKGQYFTKNILLKQKVFEFIKNKPECILEPSIGQGNLVSYVNCKLPDIKFDMYEIDDTIVLLDKIQKDKVIYGDFMKQSIIKTYKTIIGNPPYIRTKKGNLYIDFTEKCYRLLEDNGELIFIVPSDFLKLTSASKLLSLMMENGVFTDIFHPHNEKLFEGASIDVIIFRYCKNNLLEKKTMYNGKLLYTKNNNGMITFDETEKNDCTLLFEEYFDVYVGLVSGKEEVYKNNELGNIEVTTGYNEVNKYIYIDNFPCEDDNINKFLLEHKDTLLNRKIKKFNETNWFSWGAPRNIKSILSNKGKDCIYIYNLTRKTNVAFLGKVNYFGGNLLMIIPKKSVNLDKVLGYLNSNTFKNNFMFSNRFKIGHRQLNLSMFPNFE